METLAKFIMRPEVWIIKDASHHAVVREIQFTVGSMRGCERDLLVFTDEGRASQFIRNLAQFCGIQLDKIPADNRPQPVKRTMEELCQDVSEPDMFRFTINPDYLDGYNDGQHRRQEFLQACGKSNA